MSDLTIELERPLPERVRVGRGTALRVDTVARGGARITDLSFVVGADELRVPDLARRHRHGSTRQEHAWSVLVPVSPVERRAAVEVRAQAKLEDGTEVTARLGEIELAPDLEAGLGGKRLVTERERLADEVARVHRRHPTAPLVAIAMATFDPDLGLFERQVESIRGQSHPSWLCLISDDHSPARRLEQMRSILGEDQRFLLLPSATHRGAYQNFERALVAIPAAADLVALADQSDYWYPEKLERLIGELEPGVQMVHSDLRVLRPSPRATGGWQVADHSCTGRVAGAITIESLLVSAAVPGAASLFRRGLLEYALPFPDGEDTLRHDQWLALVARALGELRCTAARLSDRFEPGAAESVRSLSSDPGSNSWAPAAARILELRCAERLGPRDRAVLRSVSAGPGEQDGGSWLDPPRNRIPPRPRPGDRRPAAPAPAPRNGGTRAPTVGDRLRSASPPAGPGGETNGSSGAVRADVGVPPAIIVEGVRKSFSIPPERPGTVKAFLRHPLTRVRHDRFDALSDISFEVARGEFFGICGRNGSGKSTLLQILANVYRADEGTVMIAPRVAPMISLGIGFHPELPAPDNIVLTAELLGVPAAEARRRLDEVLGFAELEEFADLKLKNYSSGMRMRLAFATALLVDADVLLLDEILAVGDEAFKKKASEAFTELLADKTVVLVTHQMAYLQRFCSRAMLLEGGRIEMIGAPDEVAGRYAELALEGHGEDNVRPRRFPGRRRGRKPKAEIADLWLEGPDRERTAMVPAGREILVRAAIDVKAPLKAPGVRLEIRNRANSRIFAPPTLDLEPSAGRLRPGERVQVETEVENKLAAGPYTVICTVIARPDGAERVVSDAETARFEIATGAGDRGGVVDLEHSVRITGRGRHTQPGQRSDGE